MVRTELKKGARRSSPAVTKLAFELECARCLKSYRRRASSAHGCEFVRKDDSSSRVFDIRALAGLKATKRRKRRCWTPSHAQMLRIILDVFGRQHLPVSRLVFEFSEDFLQRKADELLAPPPMRSAAPSPLPPQPTQMLDEWKATPNLSTADKHWQLTPRFTPRLAQITCPEAIRFTPESFVQLPLRLGAAESMVYNPLSAYSACRFPDITSDGAWEERCFDMKAQPRWDCGGFPSPSQRPFAPASPAPPHPVLVSPLLLSVRATPLGRACPQSRGSRAVIERL